MQWPDVWRGARSPTCQYVLTAVALVAQLAGVVLVVRDVQFAGKRLAWMDHYFTKLEDMLANEDPEQIAEGWAKEQGAEWMTLFYVPYAMSAKASRQIQGTTNILRDYHRLSQAPGAWWAASWVGPVVLLAGIVAGSAAAVLGI